MIYSNNTASSAMTIDNLLKKYKIKFYAESKELHQMSSYIEKIERVMQYIKFLGDIKSVVVKITPQNFVIKSKLQF